MRSTLPLAALAVLSGGSQAWGTVELNLSSPPAALPPGELFTLRVSLLPPSEGELVTGFVMRLKASSSGVLRLVDAACDWEWPPPWRTFEWWAKPLDPYSPYFGCVVRDAVTPAQPGEFVTLRFMVQPTAPAGDYLLSLDDIRWSDPDFNDHHGALSNAVNIQVTPEPAALTLLALAACMLRRRRAAR